MIAWWFFMPRLVYILKSRVMVLSPALRFLICSCLLMTQASGELGIPNSNPNLELRQINFLQQISLTDCVSYCLVASVVNADTTIA